MLLLGDSTCIYPNYGCLDPLALNYNSLVNISDSSCTYCTTDTSLINITACDSLVWNGTTYNSSGTYFYGGGQANTNSLYYHGGGDYVEVSDSAVNDLNSGTYMTWIKLDDNTSETILVKQSDGENTYSHLGVGYYCNQTGQGASGDAGRVYFHSQNFIPEASSLGLVSNNIYSHIAITFSQDSVTFYIDGQFSGTTLGNYSIPDDLTVTSTRFGHFQTFNLHGTIDEFSLWNTMLSQQEIQQYMNCPPTGSESGLAGYWNFEEGSGTTAYDQTSNGNDGTINGATYDTNVPSQSCTLTNANGCDSTAYLILTINQADTSYTNITACDSVVWNGTTYFNSGIYNHNSFISSNNFSLNFNSGVNTEIQIEIFFTK